MSKEIVQECLKYFHFSVSLQKYEQFSQHNKSTNPIHSIEEFNQIIILSGKSSFFD